MIHVTQGVEEDVGKVDTFAIGCAGIAYGNPFNETATWGQWEVAQENECGSGLPDIVFFMTRRSVILSNEVLPYPHTSRKSRLKCLFFKPHLLITLSEIIQ